MKATAKLRYIRIAPRKVRLVADRIRGKRVQEAQSVLDFTTNKASLPILKTLLSAVSAARNNFEGKETNLYISKITIDEGPKLKRYRARARGAAFPIQKKTSHVTIVIDEIEEPKREAKKTTPKTAKTTTTPVTKTEDASVASTTDRTTSVKETDADAKIQTGKQEKPKYRPDMGRDTSRSKKDSAWKRLFRRKAI